jgi:hypothetical protein
MRVSGVIVLGVVMSLGSTACGRGDASPAAPLEVHGTLNEVMKSILFPNSNIVFDLQEGDPSTSTAEGAGVYASVYSGWERVRIAGIALAESANLVTLPDRSCDNGRPVPVDDEVFARTAQGLRDVGMAAYRFGQAERWEEEAAFELGEQLANACANCHDVYRDKIVDGQPAGLDARCVQ